jgi:hypothetical protein
MFEFLVANSMLGLIHTFPGLFFHPISAELPRVNILKLDKFHTKTQGAGLKKRMALD